MNDDITPLGVIAALLVGLFGALLWDAIKGVGPTLQRGWRQAAIERAETRIAFVERMRTRTDLVSVLILQNLAWLAAGLAWILGGVIVDGLVPPSADIAKAFPTWPKALAGFAAVAPLTLCSYGFGRIVAGMSSVSELVDTLINSDREIKRHADRLSRLRA